MGSDDWRTFLHRQWSPADSYLHNLNLMPLSSYNHHIIILSSCHHIIITSYYHQKLVLSFNYTISNVLNKSTFEPNLTKTVDKVDAVRCCLCQASLFSNVLLNKLVVGRKSCCCQETVIETRII